MQVYKWIEYSYLKINKFKKVKGNQNLTVGSLASLSLVSVALVSLALLSHSPCLTISCFPCIPFSSERVEDLLGYGPTPGHQFSEGIGTSSPNEARQGNPLLHIYLGPWTSLCMLFGWLLSLWELSGVQVS